MIKVTSPADQVWVAKATEAGQAHIFDGWDDISAEAQQGLMRQIQSIDLQLVKHIAFQCFRGSAASAGRPLVKPPEVERLPTSQIEPDRYEEYRRIGREALSAGKVALVMVSDGDTAGPLGEPVGFLPIGPVTGKSLFQLHAEKVRALNRRHKVSLRWWILLHPAVSDDVREFFRRENHFGLSSTDTVFVPEPLLPLVDRRGKFLLSEPGRIALEPSGHGGVLLELLKPEALEEMRVRGIEHVFFFRVDNPLVHIADPVFIGQHIVNRSEVSSKAIAKASADEEMTVFCQFGGAAGVIEYGDLEEDQKQKLEDGTPAFGHADMAVHIFSVDFFERMVQENVRLPFRTRERVVPCLDRRGRRSRPTEPNCLQFCVNLLDALRVARRVSILEVDRETEFSPIQQNGGDRSPLSAQRDLSRLYARWLRSAGATFRGGTEDALVAVEISPLYALDEEELRGRLELPFEIDKDVFLG